MNCVRNSRSNCNCFHDDSSLACGHGQFRLHTDKGECGENARGIAKIAPSHVADSHHRQILWTCGEYLMREIDVIDFRVEFGESRALARSFERWSQVSKTCVQLRYRCLRHPQQRIYAPDDYETVPQAVALHQ